MKYHDTAEYLPTPAGRAVCHGADAAVRDGDDRAEGARRRQLRQLPQRLHSRNAPLLVNNEQNKLYSQIHIVVSPSYFLPY